MTTRVVGVGPSIGSFRDAGDIIDDLPQDLACLRFVEPLSQATSYSLQSDVAHLNHGAFGAVTESMIELETSLRRRAHRNPSHFYDHLCLPLIRESVREASAFFNGPVILQPNCTVAMKSILQTFESSLVVARLTPIYGATTKLVTHLFPQHIIINPGFFTEDINTILKHLEAAHETQPFSVLVADHVASQTGRILPLRALVDWCRKKQVVTVIDGTQACWFENDLWPDYYVLSTHKWLGNVKTCAVIRIEGAAVVPEPVGISFGHPDPTDRHLWTGMLDYIPYIMLAKALRVYRQHGKDMLRQSLSTLAAGLKAIGLVPELSVLPGDEGGKGGLDELLAGGGHPRTMAMLRVRRFEDNLQNALEQYGVCASVKQLEGETYLRLSSWVYNTVEDFVLLSEFLQYRIRLDDCIGETNELKCARKRQQILQAFENQMDMEEKLFSHMKVESFYCRAEILRHPLIFYYGHTAVFYMNKLLLGEYLSFEDKIDPELESLCAVGVDEMSWDDLRLGNWDRTPVDQQLAQYTRVKNYRQQVKNLLSSIILDPARKLSLPITPDSIWWVLCMGIDHSRIHVETSSVIMAQIPPHMLNPSASMWPVCSERATRRDEVPPNRLVKVSGGVVSAGRSLKGTRYYGWDNEFGKGKETQLMDFEVSQMLVSNAEYEGFIEAGGFQKREYWSDDGWSWAVDKKCPRFWLDENDGKLKLRTLNQEVDMPFDWPVVVNNYEAEAFCCWKSVVLGKRVRMISHPEWLLLSGRSQSLNYNINFQKGGSACPVNKYSEPLGQDGSPVYDLRGNLWQHSRSLLTVLPEFEVHPLYDDFSLPTIDGKHSFILGGSWTSVGNCAEMGARYGFRRHFYQFAGIRYVCSDNEDLDVPKTLIQGEAALASSENFLNFDNPVLLGTQPVANAMEEFGTFASRYVKHGDSVLILNGSVGRISIEIAQRSSPASILHTDPTANTLDAFLYAKMNSSIRFDRTIEGNIFKTEDIEFSPEWVECLAKTDISVKQIDIFRLASDVLEPRDVVVLDLVQLNKVSCSRRGQIPPNLHILIKPGGRLVFQRSVPLGGEGTPPTIPGFVYTGESMTYCHIAQETRRKHMYSNTKCFVYERLNEESRLLIENSNLSNEIVAEQYLQYEQDDEVAKYTRFHFMYEDICGIPNFPSACSKICVEACKKFGIPLHEAIEAGCGPGRLGIDLSSVFEHVTAFDYSVKVLSVAMDHKTKNMTLFRGDAHFVDEHPEVQGKKYNLVVSANVLDRMSNPGKFIQSCKSILADDGLLILFSPFSWVKDFTKEEHWLGGFRKDAEVVWSLQGTIREAGPELRLYESPSHVPFAIPNPDGTIGYVYSQCMMFGKK